MLTPHISRNVKACCGFHHKQTGALLCPTSHDWANTELISFDFVLYIPPIIYCRIKEKLCNGQFQIAGNQWPILLYASYTYDPNDLWNGLLYNGILITASHSSLFHWLLIAMCYHRLTNIFSLLWAPLILRSWRQHACAMLIFTECMLSQKCQLLMWQHK